MSVDTTVELYRVTRDGKQQFAGTHNQCFAYILNHQSQSVEWAMRHEGWDIEEFTGERNAYRRQADYRGEVVYHNEFLNNYHTSVIEPGTNISVPLTGRTVEDLHRLIDDMLDTKRSK